MTFATFDDSGWPVIRVTFHSTPSNQHEFDQYLSRLSGLYDHREPFWVIFDGRHVGKMGVSYLIQQARYMKATEGLAKVYMRKAAVIIDNNFVHGIINALFAIRKPVSDLQIFTTLDEGEGWIHNGDKSPPSSPTSPTKANNITNTSMSVSRTTTTSTSPVDLFFA